jgi:hypothetical protein
MRMLSAELCQQEPLNSLPNLGDKLEHRVTERPSDLPPPVNKPWLAALAECLRRVKLPDEGDAQRVRQTAARLAQTVWQPFRLLKVSPFLDGTPAGQPFTPTVLWEGTVLYVREGRLVRVADEVIRELGRAFDHAEVQEAIKMCFERDAEYVTEYLSDHFELLSAPPGMPAVPATEMPATTAPAGESGTVEDGAVSEPPKVDLAVAATNAPPRPVREPLERAPAKPSLVARFATLKGFKWDDRRGCYVHLDGSVLRKAEGCFNLELVTPSGDVECRYWVSSQKILDGQIELAAELWEQIRGTPSITSLVLEKEEDQPFEITGRELMQLEEKGEIKLYPAKYRLRWRSNDDR